MKLLFKNADVFGFGKSDIMVSGSVIVDISPGIDVKEADVVYNLEGLYIFPGFTDVHVHLREPGFSYKETVYSGTRAAAHGGFTTVCAMPNLNPVPDSIDNLKAEEDIIRKDALIRVCPYGSITAGEKGEKLSDMEAISKSVAAFTDDGRGVQSEDMMKSAMTEAKRLGKIIAAHCEDNSLLNGGIIHDGEYAKAHSYKGICSESEWGQIERDLRLAKQTGCRYHVCHISTKESVELIRRAKADGVDVTCETAPHYLVFNDMQLRNSGAFKMNPPIRSESDRLALIEGIKDGTVDMIATDHAPHSSEEKSHGLNSLNGIVGLETAFCVLCTKLVRKNIITLDDLINLMSINPAKRFFGEDASLGAGKTASFTAFDLSHPYKVNSEEFLSMGKSTPFEGMEVYGKCALTVSNGKIAWKEDVNEAGNI